MIAYRPHLTALLFLLAVASGLFLPGWWGMVIAPIFIVMALLLWIIPRPELKEDDGRQDPPLQRTSQMVLGLGIGLLAAVVLPFLPVWAFWIAIGVGMVVIIYFTVQLLRN